MIGAKIVKLASQKALGGYAAKAKDPDKKHGCKVRHSVAYFLGLGFQLIEWDGFTRDQSSTKSVASSAVLTGQPRNPTYQATVEHASQAIRDAGSMAWFPTVNANSPLLDQRQGVQTTIAEDLLANNDVECTAGFADGLLLTSPVPPPAEVLLTAAFALWAPHLYQCYHGCDTKLCTVNENLRCPFKHSVFFAAAFNFGPNCSASALFKALGRFNPKMDNGCQTIKELAEDDPKEYEHLMALRAARWERGS
ncbi:hypothetical protein B0H14DRAFT_2595705 [Mycena olivaceomarginata]|nr:hypothetical protein B0H14DRAFT_2595705 [Mycena olivaceomarginata]